MCIGLVDVMYPYLGFDVEFHEFDPPMHKFHWVSLNKTLASHVGFVPRLELCPAGTVPRMELFLG